MAERLNITSGTEWEKKFGYSRAVRIGNIVEVAGTVAVDEHGVPFAPNNPYKQALFIFTKIERALLEAGAAKSDVVRTRMYVTDISCAEEVARAHGEVFGAVRPATTLVAVKNLISPEYLVEIEASAYITSKRRAKRIPASNE
jgi:enamine deaminase RidA (YjgF/YER057c/UK114 family)